MLERDTHTPKSTSNLPNHRCSRRVSEHPWDSITSRKGTSVCEGTHRDLRSESSYLCHESARNRRSEGALTSRRVSLHDQSGQKEDIVDYVRSIVYSNSEQIMGRWRTEDKELVIKTLSERANGM